MKLELICLILFLAAPFRSSAQDTVLFRLSEQQILKMLPKYREVSRDTFPHEFSSRVTLKKKGSNEKLQLSFFGGICTSVTHFRKKSMLASMIRAANEKHERIGEKTWRSKDKKFEVFIHGTAEHAMSIYTMGVSDFGSFLK